MHPEYPFISNAFLDPLEKSGCVSKSNGWHPNHISSSEGGKDLFMPLYVKDHSMGEYVFDQLWANAFYQHGLDYYPKLITSIPFTPVTGTRVRCKNSITKKDCETLREKIESICINSGGSSWHALFVDKNLVEKFSGSDLLTRTGIQYHWQNNGYDCFDDFLARLNSRKRKMIKKERSAITKNLITIKVVYKADITESMWDFFFEMYQRTYLKRNGTLGYLNREFFRLIAHSLSEQICMIVAEKDSRMIGCALYFFDDTKLYGRYWGSIDQYEFLHFELCYYQGIELAIKNNLLVFDAGAQGEHKLLRGFEPIKTVSLHWIRDERFRSAISDFLIKERAAVERQIDLCRTVLPYKRHA